MKKTFQAHNRKAHWQLHHARRSFFVCGFSHNNRLVTKGMVKRDSPANTWTWCNFEGLYYRIIVFKFKEISSKT
jgi:hypothetical protein